MDNFLYELENKYHLREIKLEEICNFFQEYGDKATLDDISEGFVKKVELVKLYIRDANSENKWLPDELKKYDLYILGFVGKKLVYTFYREEFVSDLQLISYIESFKNK